MGWSKYLIIGLLLSVTFRVSAQENKFAAADSASKALYIAGQWDRLITTGNDFIEKGVDFPLLRLRIGLAEMANGNYASAAAIFEKILSNDSFNQDARLYLYYCDKYLNRDINALHQTRFLDSTRLKTDGFMLHNVDIESSFKIAENIDRGNSSYSRAGISLNLFKKLQLDQSVSYFKQYVYLSELNSPWRADEQVEYYVSPQLAVSNTFSLFGGYHYMNTAFNGANTPGNVGIVGFNYTKSHVSLEAEADFGTVMSASLNQYNFRIAYYPMGNFKLYLIAAPSYHTQGSINNFIYNQTIGFQALNKLWLVSFGVFGNQGNYIDAKGLYIYNTYDKTSLKLGEVAYFGLSLHALARICYAYEKKEPGLANSYNQHSITAGILWKF